MYQCLKILRTYSLKKKLLYESNKLALTDKAHVHGVHFPSPDVRINMLSNEKFQAFADLLETGLCLVSSHAKLFLDYTGMQTPGQHEW